MASPSHRWHQPLIWISGLTLLGLLLRALLFARGFTDDEVMCVQPLSLWEIIRHRETGVNPPLHRLLVNGFVPEGWVVYGGRILSLLCSLGTLPVAFLLGRRAAPSLPPHLRNRAGLLLAGLLAIHPLAIRYGVQNRAYALWLLLAMVHTLALVTWLQRPEKRTACVLLGSALLMVWTHYASVPLLLVLGLSVAVCIPDRRRLLGLYLPAAAGFCLLLPLILQYPESRRMLAGGNLLRGLITALGGGLSVVGGAATAVVLVAGVVRRAELPRAQQGLWLGLLAGILATLSTALLHHSGSRLGLLTVPWLFPLVVVWAVRPAASPRWLRPVGVLLLVVTALVLTAAEHTHVESRDTIGQFAATWRTGRWARAGRPVYVHPASHIATLSYTLGARLPRTRGSGCGATQCFDWRSTRFYGVGSLRAPLIRRPCLLVTFAHQDPFSPPTGCTPLLQRRRLQVFDCP